MKAKITNLDDSITMYDDVEGVDTDGTWLFVYLQIDDRTIIRPAHTITAIETWEQPHG